MRGARLLVAAVLQAAAAGAGGGGGGAPSSGSGSGWGASVVSPAPAVPPRTLTEPFTTADDDDEPLPGLEDDDDQDANNTERGMYLGSACEFTCNPKLHHVFCDPITGHCECDKKYPVKLGPTKGCAKPKSLGEQCFYRQACKYFDDHASCVQINHNAICQCDIGYHSVSYSKHLNKVFCTKDLALLTGDVPTLLGVCSGIALLAGLLCLVLHLYTRGRNPYSRPHHYADAHLPPPMFFTSEAGIPLAVQGGRASSRGSIRSSAGSGGGGSSRRGLSATSRAGSRRSSLASLQSTSSSVRSYSMKRFEKEREQKEKRQQMQMRLAQLHANMTGGENGKTAPTPSPRTPNSTDGLLPAVTEGRELSLSQCGLNKCGSSSLEGIIGPCSSSGTSY